MKEIVIKISPDAEIEAEGLNFGDSSCEKMIDILKANGITVSELQFKPEHKVKEKSGVREKGKISR